MHHLTPSLLQAAAENNLLDDVVHRRANASLSFFAATQVFVTLITFVPNPVYPHPIINVPAAIGFEALALGQWWVAGRNYAKYSEGIGANPIKIIKVALLHRLTRYHPLAVSHCDTYDPSYRAAVIIEHKHLLPVILSSGLQLAYTLIFRLSSLQWCLKVFNIACLHAVHCIKPLLPSAMYTLTARRNSFESAEPAIHRVRLQVLLDVLMLQSYIQDFSTLPTQTSGLNSGIYAALTAAFVITGFTYQFAPVNTMNAIFGMAAEKGLEDKYLWQLIGGSIATCIAPIAYTQRVSVSMMHYTRWH